MYPLLFYTLLLEPLIPVHCLIQLYSLSRILYISSLPKNSDESLKMDTPLIHFQVHSAYHTSYKLQVRAPKY